MIIFLRSGRLLRRWRFRIALISAPVILNVERDPEAVISPLHCTPTVRVDLNMKHIKSGGGCFVYIRNIYLSVFIYLFPMTQIDKQIILDKIIAKRIVFSLPISDVSRS